MSRRTTTAPAPVRTLADALRGWDRAALAALLVARPDLARPAPTDLGQLATRAGARGSIALAVDELDTAHVTVVEALALLPQPVSVAAVQAVVYAEPATVAHVLQRLRDLALVWGDERDLRLVRAAHDVVGPTPAGLGPSLVPLLTAAPPARLRALADDLDITADGAPADTASRIAAAYTDHGWASRRIDEATAAAGDEAARILTRLGAGPPTARLGAVTVEPRVATAEGPVQHLLARGLVVALDARTVTLPREVGLQVRGGRTTTAPVDSPPSPATRPVDAGLVDSRGAGAAFELVRRVELLLETWGATPPGVLRSGGIGVRDLRGVAALLDVDEGEAGLLLEVAYAAGLFAVGKDGERDQVWLPTEDFDAWRAWPPARRWSLLTAAWLQSPRATVLVGQRDERGRGANPLVSPLEHSDPAAVRRATLQVLADAGPDACVGDADQVVAAVAWIRPRRVPLREATVRQTLVEASALGVMAMQALTGAGRALLTSTAQAAETLAPLLPQPVDHVLLQADLTAVAPGPLQPAVASGLALLADVESRGGATVYRFSADSVRRALDAGWTAGDMQHFLRTRSRTAVPQPLTYLVDDCARRHGRLRVGTAGTYLRVDQPAELDTVLSDAALASLGLRRIAPTVALSDLPPDLVVARMRQAHRAPLLEAADGSAIGTAEGSSRARAGHVPGTTCAAIDPAAAAAVVSALRAGDRARTSVPVGGRAGGPSRLVDDLRAAAEAGRTVSLAYLDATGTVSKRVVDPVAVDGGRLTAYDHRSARTRGFTLHRISDVVAAG